MGRVASFDIETYCPVEEIDKKEVEYLKSRRDYGEDKEGFHRDLFTNPYVSFLVSCAFFYPEENRAEVLFIGDGSPFQEIRLEEKTVKVSHMCFNPSTGLYEAERRLLEEVWRRLEGIDRLISFHGKGFDLEFIKVRTIIHGLKPTGFHSYFTFNRIEHYDLKDLLSVAGRSYKLEFISKRFNISIDKGGVDGSRVRELFSSGKYEELANYNVRDALITGLLYERCLYYLIPCNEDILEEFKSLGIEEANELIKRALTSSMISKDEVSCLIDYMEKGIKPFYNSPSQKQIFKLGKLLSEKRLTVEELCQLLDRRTLKHVLNAYEGEQDQIT
jgi:hypothetical protein